MNNGYRWLSENEVEILRDDDTVRGKVDDNINVEKILLYQNIIEIYEKRMLQTERDMINYVAVNIINNKAIKFQLIASLVFISLSLIFSSVTFYSIMTKISFGLLAYFGVQNLIYVSQIKRLQADYNASMELKKKYEKSLEDSKRVEKGLDNSFHKSINVISLSEYNTMFYELADRQVNSTLEKNKVKKLTLKKKR